MPPTVDATLTDFLRDPNAVIEKLDQADVVLHRRNAGDLRLSLQSRSEAGDDALRFVSRFLAAAFSDTVVRDRLVEAATALPWLTLLPATDRATFAADLIRSADAAGELGSMEPVGRLLTKWKAVAAANAETGPAAAPARLAPGKSARPGS